MDNLKIKIVKLIIPLAVLVSYSCSQRDRDDRSDAHGTMHEQAESVEQDQNHRGNHEEPKDNNMQGMQEVHETDSMPDDDHDMHH
jgi:hypothetical protein